MIPAEASLLRIYVGANERRHGKPLYESIVTTARGMDLAGASVFPVELSYGTGRRIHDASSDYGFTELPVVIEVVDAPERVDALVAALGDLLDEATVTLESVRVIHYSHDVRRP